MQNDKIGAWEGGDISRRKNNLKKDQENDSSPLSISQISLK